MQVTDFNQKTKLHRLDPRHFYKSFMTNIVYPGTEKRINVQTSVRHDGYFPSRPSEIVPIGSLDKHCQFARFELFSTKVASDEEEATETLACLWPFFKLTRLIGMCPITRRGNSLVVAKFYHPSWILTWVALFIQVIMVGNAVNQTQKAEKTEDLVKKLNSVIYYGHTLANGLYMTWKVKELPQFLVSCKRIETMCKKHQRQLKPDDLVRECFLLFLFFSVCQAFGNVLYFTSIAVKLNVKTFPQFFKSFNSEFIGRWGSSFSGMFFCFGEFYCDMGWGFADIFLALISLVFGRFFIRLNKILGSKGTIFTLAKIEELRCDHREICHLVQLCNNLFAPLFLLTYVANVAYLFTRLYTGLADDLNDPVMMIRIESLYAFCYQIFIKILAPSYLAAKLNEKAHEGLTLIQTWPSTLDSSDSKYRLLVIGRFVSQFVTTPVGISGCGYFLISKSFMVTLISALVTYEVIILQFQGASLKLE